ncbi:Hypothetical predicted protein [Xyrichtys novacula]|uniref:Uncharacterized protein n=1 Tax=Xyrichtys novacula TaxID=13765 RepID=A0AAV1FEI5_XYRNO|nr:Hypothetical predicted protein [Xyrichtys novacula]
METALIVYSSSLRSSTFPRSHRRDAGRRRARRRFVSVNVHSAEHLHKDEALSFYSEGFCSLPVLMMMMRSGGGGGGGAGPGGRWQGQVSAGSDRCHAPADLPVPVGAVLRSGAAGKHGRCRKTPELHVDAAPPPPPPPPTLSPPTSIFNVKTSDRTMAPPWAPALLANN